VARSRAAESPFPSQSVARPNGLRRARSHPPRSEVRAQGRPRRGSVAAGGSIRGTCRARPQDRPGDRAGHDGRVAVRPRFTSETDHRDAFIIDIDGLTFAMGPKSLTASGTIVSARGPPSAAIGRPCGPTEGNGPDASPPPKGSRPGFPSSAAAPSAIGRIGDLTPRRAGATRQGGRVNTRFNLSREMRAVPDVAGLFLRRPGRGAAGTDASICPEGTYGLCGRRFCHCRSEMIRPSLTSRFLNLRAGIRQKGFIRPNIHTRLRVIRPPDGGFPR